MVFHPLNFSFQVRYSLCTIAYRLTRLFFRNFNVLLQQLYLFLMFNLLLPQNFLMLLVLLHCFFFMLYVLLPQLVLYVDRKSLHFPNITLVRCPFLMHLLNVCLKTCNFHCKIFASERLTKVLIMMANLTHWFYRCKWLKFMNLFIFSFYLICMLRCPLLFNWLDLFIVTPFQFRPPISVLPSCLVKTSLVLLS